jgi:ribosome-binding protein aMBF1 (putative translation factor)
VADRIEINLGNNNPIWDIPQRVINLTSMASSLHSHNYRAFINLLVNARISSGLTQVQVAEKLGKLQSYVSKYERCERRLDFSEFEEIAEVLGVNVQSFVNSYRKVKIPVQIRSGKRIQRK